MLLGERGTQTGHGAVKPRLMERDGVRTSPAVEDDAPQLGSFCDVQRKEVAALIVDDGVRRVEIFRHGVIRQHPGHRSR